MPVTVLDNTRMCEEDWIQLDKVATLIPASNRHMLDPVCSSSSNRLAYAAGTVLTRMRQQV